LSRKYAWLFILLWYTICKNGKGMLVKGRYNG
jgi:hypothetical protein